MKIAGVLLVIGILLSYMPMTPADDCREGDHSENMKLDCGYSFHCPVLLAKLLPEPLAPAYLGRLVLPLSFQTFEELARPIFHPPENRLETHIYRE